MTPSADAVTLREHHTFAELPDGNYKPRVDDPRAGYGGLQYVDYAAPLGTPMVQRFIRRHRLEKVDPSARVERPEEADRLLRRSRHARADSLGAARRRALVEPGVRGRRLSQRVSGRAAARRRRPDGHPLQHDQLGPPLDARLELRRARSRIRAPARSSRRRSRSDRCAIGRTT